MRRISVFTTLVICLMMMNVTLFAQAKVKVAHLNSADLMQVMPGRDTAQKIIETYAEMDENISIW